MSTYHHAPVMVDEVVELLRPVPPGVLVDANVGGGGHAEALLDANAGLRLIGFDLDADAIDAAATRLAPFGARVTLHHGAFDTMTEVVNAARHESDVSAVLFDLGLSSHQVDEPERGFSFHDDGPLDMRFDQTGPVTAADIVNEWDASELERVLRDNADERHARSIAGAVVASRPVSTTLELVEIIGEAVPAAYRRRTHPARRTFQALRMAVNDELGQLRSALDQAIALLRERGRLAVLTYHSGEDGVVKQRLRLAATGGCECPPGLPCVCGARPAVRLLRPLSRTPSTEETATNPRSRSARLRGAERPPAGATPMSGSAPGRATTGAPR